MRVGILGGTFNPVHLGHLIMAQRAAEEFKLGKVMFIPCAVPPHKRSGDLACPQDRFRMVQRAIGGNPKFEACDLEIRRGGKSYSYDTLRQLHAADGEGDRFFFITGADGLAQIRQWHRIQDLMKLCRFIVVARPGVPTDKILKGMAPPDRKYFGQYVLDACPMGISSREIRRRVRAGLSVRYFVSEPVAAYVEDAGLYTSHARP